MGNKVAILGAGVAGMTAAHELIERGFAVDVYERNPDLGGKARSNSKPGSGREGREDLPGEHGFRFFPGFYRHVPDTMRRIPYGAGNVRAILSVDVSDWHAFGGADKPASQSTMEEIKDEVWSQLKQHLNDQGGDTLNDEDLLDSYLDPAIKFAEDDKPTNDEPLLINTVDSWQCRSPAVTNIQNLFLAGDYVQTDTDLATMESANEAARRAVNGILKAAGSKARRCKIWKPREPFLFGPLRQIDRWRMKRGLPPSPRVVWFARHCVLPIWRMAHESVRFVKRVLRRIGFGR